MTTYGSAAGGFLDQRDASAFLASSGFELALRLPELVSIFAGETKRVLRCAMKGLLPEPIRTRRDKLGFVTAEEQWMKELLRDQCVHRAKESFGYANGVLRPEVVNEVEGGSMEDVDSAKYRGESYVSAHG
ncbi:MAG: asparagine synthase-related protein [Verrucomicrobiota bacterium]|nr:asparagine synthase-related protein [Verrucomicrobiota bacterium]